MSRSKQIVSSIIALAIVIGLVSYYKIGFTGTKAATPPDGDGIQSIYIDDVSGNDLGDGSMQKPYKTIDLAFRRMNASMAPSVQVYIKGTSVPYKTDGGANFKRNNVTVQQWGNRPVIAGNITPGAWNLLTMAIDSKSGITVKNIDFYNVGFDAYTMPSISGTIQNVQLENVTFKVDRPDLLGDHPVVWFHQMWGGEYGQYTISEIGIKSAKVILMGAHKVGETYDAVRLRDVDGAEINNVTFVGQLWNAGVNVVNSANVVLVKNNFSDLTPKMSLYKFDQVINSMVNNMI